MNSEKNTELAVEKTIPKFLSILMIMEERARQYQALEPAQREVEEHVPDELMEMICDFNSTLTEGISPDQEGLHDQLTERFNKYLRKIGLDSLDVAEAVADPSLERVDALVKDITKVLGRYVGANPVPVLKNQLPFYVVSPSGNLKDDERLDRRAADAAHVLAKEGKTMDDVSEMSFEDIMRIRKQIQERGRDLETREFYEEQIAEKYARHILGLSDQIKPEQFSTPKMEQLSELIKENLPSDIPASEMEEDLAYLDQGGLGKLISMQSKMIILKAAQQFIYCAIDMGYIDIVRELVQLDGIDVEMDGKTHHVSPLDYVAIGRKDMTVLKKLKDYLVDIAMEKGLDIAVTNDKINEGLRFAYGDKEAYITHMRFKLRVENVFAQCLRQDIKISVQELTANPVYQYIVGMIDQQAVAAAQSVFGE